MLKFGIFDHVEQRTDVDLAEQFADRLRFTEQADKAGIYGYHVAEHHHSPLYLAPNQAIFLAAVAERTTRLRFGPLVTVLPLHHPVRLIEEICMIDQLSGGRYQIGVGRGTTGGAEWEMWGGDPEETDARFEESFEILFRGLTNEFLSHRGRFFKFENLYMALRPKQQPHPPFWYAGNPKRAAAWGMNFLGDAPIVRLAPILEEYRADIEAQRTAANPNLPHEAEPLHGAMKHVYLAESDAAAVERARQALDVYRSHFAKPIPEGAARTPLAAKEAAENPGQASFEQLVAVEHLIAGSPATVRDFLARYVRDAGANYFVCSFQWGDLSHDEASHSLDLFTSQVMPDFMTG